MRRSPKKWIAALLLSGIIVPAHAQGIFTGTWKIARYVTAPWADAAHPDTSNTDMQLYLNKTVTFAPRAVTGPAPFGCRNPRYEIRKDDGPDMLFQGALAEPDNAGHPRDAAALARQLGVTTPTIPTLANACSQFEFHMLKPDVLMFGLNNRVFLLDRVRP